MTFLQPAEGETRLPVLRLWELAQMIQSYAAPETGGFSGLTALRHLLECREAFERAWRLEMMKREAREREPCSHLADSETPGEGLSAEPCPRCRRYYSDDEN